MQLRPQRRCRFPYQEKSSLSGHEAGHPEARPASGRGRYARFVPTGSRTTPSPPQGLASPAVSTRARLGQPVAEAEIAGPVCPSENLFNLMLSHIFL